MCQVKVKISSHLCKLFFVCTRWICSRLAKNKKQSTAKRVKSENWREFWWQKSIAGVNRPVFLVIIWRQDSKPRMSKMKTLHSWCLSNERKGSWSGGGLWVHLGHKHDMKVSSQILKQDHYMTSQLLVNKLWMSKLQNNEKFVKVCFRSSIFKMDCLNLQ